MADNGVTFNLNVVGESGERWIGTFKIKTRLSHKDTLSKDGFRRDLLGGSPGEPSLQAATTAELLATIWVHLQEAPQWWKSSNNGLDLEDEEPILEIFNEIVKVTKAAAEARAKKVEAAKADLAKTKE
jgi:hypothetical protein